MQVTPMAMENLAIAQHWNIIQYATIHGRGYWQAKGLCLLTPNNTTTLDVITNHVILHVQKVLPFGILLLEGWNGQTWKNHVHNCVLCHLRNVDGQTDPSSAIILVNLWCMLCGQSIGIATMLVCDWCSGRWHMTCLTLPLD